MRQEYWNDADGNPPDWELVSKARMPSPLLPVATERVGAWQHKREENDEGAEGASLDLAKELAQARKQTDEIAKAESFKTQTDAQQRLADEEAEFNVEGWDFSSEYAIEQEYVENHDELVSAF